MARSVNVAIRTDDAIGRCIFDTSVSFEAVRVIICHLAVSPIPAAFTRRALAPSIESNYYLRFSASLPLFIFGALNFVQIERN